MNTLPSFSNRFSGHPGWRVSGLICGLQGACLAGLLFAGAINGVAGAQDQAKSKTATQAKDAAKSTSRRRRPVDELRLSQEKLKSLQPFRAEIVETIVVREKTFRAKGKYLQGKGLKLRLEFELEIGRTKGTLVQVCNGKTLWTQNTIGATVQATRRDVPRIIKELKQLSQAGTKPRPRQFETDLGLGGIEALLTSLERTMTFTLRRERQVQGRPFVIIEGSWNATFLETLTDDRRPSSGELPEYIPDRVRIYFDKTTQFPHRIVYMKKQPDREGLRPMVSLEFRKVEVNATIDDSVFVFKAGKGVQVQDVTNEFIKQVRQIRSAEPAPGQSGTKAKAKTPPRKGTR